MIDFDSAIEAHVEWKMRLRILLDSGEAASVHLDEFESADHCSFGRWLRGDGRRFESDPVYEALERFHVEVHRSAAKLIRQAATGEPTEAVFDLAHAALATSAVVERRTILDPRSGRVAGHAAQATVLAPTATLADAWSTAAVVAPLGDLATATALFDNSGRLLRA